MRDGGAVATGAVYRAEGTGCAQPPRLSRVTEPAPEALDEQQGEVELERLRRLLRLPTVSRSDADRTDWPVFDAFLELLAELYPRVHGQLERILVDGRTRLIRWPGRSDVDPLVLMAHYDVVAADEPGWTHPPFDAVVTGEGEARVLWGRGALDDKGAVAGVLGAVEHLLGDGLVPERDVWISLGHNEETAGSGAPAAVEELRRRGVRPGLVLDEGGAIVQGAFPGVAAPTAVIGVAEKGIASFELLVRENGGHASTPPRWTATARLARAILRIQRRPFPARLSAPNLAMLRVLAPHAHGPVGAMLRALRVTRPLVLAALARASDETAAMVRTTRAVTVLEGSAAENALAESARAVVNVRIATGSSVAEAEAHLRRAVRDPRVELRALHASDPSPVSPSGGPAWQLLAGAVERCFPGTIVTPYVQLGASDSRFFTAISEHVYRFTPFAMSADERATLHAVDERMRVRSFLDGAAFYRHLIRSLC